MVKRHESWGSNTQKKMFYVSELSCSRFPYFRYPMLSDAMRSYTTVVAAIGSYVEVGIQGCSTPFDAILFEFIQLYSTLLDSNPHDAIRRHATFE